MGSPADAPGRFRGVVETPEGDRNLLQRLIDPIPIVERAAIRASQAITEPSLDRSKLGAQVRGFVGGALEGAATLVNPLELASQALGFGAIKRAAAIPGQLRRLARPLARFEHARPTPVPKSSQLAFQPSTTGTSFEAQPILGQTLPGGPQRAQKALGAPRTTSTPTQAAQGVSRAPEAPIRTPVEEARRTLAPGERVFRTPEAKKALKAPQTFGFSDLNRLLSRTPEEVDEVFGLVEKAGARPDQVKGLREAFATLQRPTASSFAQRVQRVASETPAGPFAHKVPISAVYERFRRQFPDVGSLDDFKHQLLRDKGVGLASLDDPSLLDTATRTKRAISTPTRDLHFIERALKGEAGGVSVQTAADLAGAGVGGLVGASADADSDEDRLVNMLGGALLGTVGVRGGRALGRTFRTGKGAGSTFLALDSANLLAGPAAIKASLGGVGAIVTGMAERVATGAPGMARRMAGYLATQGPKDYLNVLFRGKGSIDTNRILQPTNKVLDVVLRPFKAMDTVASKALQAGGYTADDAANLLLTGPPTSEKGQRWLRNFQDGFITQLFVKFPTVRIQSLERGVEFSPFGLMKNARLNLRNAPAAQGLTEGQRRFRAAAGLGATAGGVAFGLSNPSFQEAGLVSALAGPAALPAAVGIGIGKGFREAGLGGAIQTGGSELAFTVPQVGGSDVRRFNPVDPRTGRLTVPPRFRPLPFR